MARRVAQAEVLAMLPRELRSRAGRIRERFHVDAPDWFAAREEVPHLDAVADAVWTGRRLDVVYAGRERRLDPLGLVLKAGRWYLVAGHRGRPATWRIARITAAEVRDERPDGFDLPSWWAGAQAEFDLAIRRSTVHLKVTTRARRTLQRALTLPRLDAGEPDADGWHELTLPVETDEIAAAQLLALGGDVEVLAPPSVRRALAEAGAAMAARNA